MKQRVIHVSIDQVVLEGHQSTPPDVVRDQIGEGIARALSNSPLRPRALAGATRVRRVQASGEDTWGADVAEAIVGAKQGRRST